MTLDNLNDKILVWANERGIFNNPNIARQALKLFEEGGETAGAIVKNNLPEAKDGIGDCVVVLTILAKQLGFTLQECVEAAYTEIAQRKGILQNGIFVKEADVNVQA